LFLHLFFVFAVALVSAFLCCHPQRRSAAAVAFAFAVAFEVAVALALLVVIRRRACPEMG
jgi:lipopolysaccharide export LptBFGC system permease protein LptF